MKKQTTEQVRKPRNPTGKGGFKDHPELINPGGRPKNQESFSYWMNYFKNLPISEFLGWLKKNPEDVRTVAAELAYNRVFNAREDLTEFKEVANRTEGMPIQSTDITSFGEKLEQLIIYKPERLKKELDE